MWSAAAGSADCWTIASADCSAANAAGQSAGAGNRAADFSITAAANHSSARHANRTKHAGQAAVLTHRPGAANF